LYDKIPNNSDISTYKNPTIGIFDSTNLTRAFFSANNVAFLQHGIQQGVLRISHNKYRIGLQDQDTLFIIMRSIYLQHSKNLMNNTESQVAKLNSYVLDYCIKQVYSEAQCYMKYLTDVSTMYTPMDHPILAYPEEKQLELHSWF
jgi:hypothetical protein